MYNVKNKMINCYYLKNYKIHIKTIVEILRKR